MKMVVVVKVSNLDRALNFYTETLGLPCRRKEKEWAAIVVGDTEIHLYLHGGVTSGVEFYVEDIEETVSNFKSRGVRFFSDLNQPNLIKIDNNDIAEFPWGKAAFFTDSESNSLSLIEDF